MTYKVKLEVFEGPLDLLLYLIKKDELDIHDIPIAKITEQYLEYLELMKILDLNIAGEFLVMAATLMHIKSRMLLPPEALVPEEEEEEDPRAELVRKLLEYKKFKEAAGQLSVMEREQAKIFVRLPGEQDRQDAEETQYFEASLFDLLSAFAKAMKNVPREIFHEIIKDEFTVEGKIHDILHMLVKEQIIHLVNLFERAKNKLEIIATFLAILELIRVKEIVVVQEHLFGEIQVIRNSENIKPRIQDEVKL